MGRKREAPGPIVPVAYSEKIVEAILKRIKNGTHPVVAARAEGVSKIQWGTWTNPELHANLALVAAVDKAEAESECDLLDVIRTDDQGKRWRAALAVLERRFPERWTLRVDPNAPEQTLNLVVKLADDRATLDADSASE